MDNSNESVHISSLVVYCLPKKLDTIIHYAKNIDGVDVVAHDISDKLILVLETINENNILSIIDRMMALKSVITTTMVYHELDC